jgi:hypothetical protein
MCSEAEASTSDQAGFPRATSLTSQLQSPFAVLKRPGAT